MKLFIFEHCPFCTKTRMVAGMKKLDIDIVYMQNDDVEQRIAKVGSSTVPILEKDDGSNMAESLDIAKYLDNYDHNSIIERGTCASEVSEWLKSIQSLFFNLTFPRWTQLNLPEFQRQEAIDWYTEKKQDSLAISFEQALAQSEEYITKLNPLLVDVNFITLPSEKGEKITWDDVHLFPVLRNLSVVKGLSFPLHLKNYLDEISDLTNIDLFFKQAV